MFGDRAALNHIGLLRPGLIGAAGGTVELPHFAQAEDNPMERRLFVACLMRLSAGAVVLPEAFRRGLGLADDDPDLLPEITLRDVAALVTCHDTFMRLSYSVGAVARKAVLGQLSFATAQLKAGVPGSTQALNAWRILTARLADTACWMSVDAGRVPQARALAALSAEVAANIEDRHMTGAASGYFVSKLADLAVQTGQPRTALDLSDQAASISGGASPTTRHAIHAIKAEAFGALGNAREVEREIGLAAEAFAQTSTADVEREPWAWHCQMAGRHFYHRGSAQTLLVRTNPDAVTDSLVSDTCESFGGHHTEGVGPRHAAQANLRAGRRC